ncbi:hypothetical protein ABW20_dc0105758 [Dactylellina cionopaga]|nr:hypothetical protein ABW20_dc0105758 [Dactylellina cionopaga]
MDPLSITVSVSSLIVVCARIIKFSSDVSNAYRSASFALSAIASECAVISASLTRLQNMLLSQPERLSALAESLDTALLGCALTMSVLQEQIGGLAKETEDGELKPKKFKYVLEQDYLKELLQQIRGQQVSITLLLQTYQRYKEILHNQVTMIPAADYEGDAIDSESLTKIEQSMQDYNIILQQMAGKGISLWRGAHSSGQFHVPTAIIGNSEVDSVFELSSIITDTRFDFDDQVVSSKAYRRALASLKQAQNDPGQLDNNLNGPQQMPDTFGGIETNNFDEEVASSEIELVFPSIGEPNILNKDHHELEMDTPSGRKHLDNSAPMSSRSEETGDITTEVVSDMTVQSQPVPDWMPSGHGYNYFQPLPSAESIEHHEYLANSQSPDLQQDSTPLAVLEMTVVESPPLVPVATLNVGSYEPSSLHTENPRQEPESGLGEHATSPDAISSSSFQSSLTDASKQAGKAIAHTSPKSSPRRFQRFFSELFQPSMPQPTPAFFTEIQRKLVIVGDPVSGKTALLIQFSKGHYITVNVPTVFENYVADIEVDGNCVELALWDTGGLEDYDRLRPLSYPDAHVILLCFSVANRDTWDNVQEKWISEVLHFCRGLPIILVGTQIDCRDNPENNPFGSPQLPMVTPGEGEDLRKKIGALKYLECSARSNEGVREVFEAAARAALTTKTKRKKKKRQ